MKNKEKYKYAVELVIDRPETIESRLFNLFFRRARGCGHCEKAI